MLFYSLCLANWQCLIFHFADFLFPFAFYLGIANIERVFIYLVASPFTIHHRATIFASALKRVKYVFNSMARFAVKTALRNFADQYVAPFEFLHGDAALSMIKIVLPFCLVHQCI